MKQHKWGKKKCYAWQFHHCWAEWCSDLHIPVALGVKTGRSTNWGVHHLQHWNISVLRRSIFCDTIFGSRHTFLVSFRTQTATRCCPRQQQHTPSTTLTWQTPRNLSDRPELNSLSTISTGNAKKRRLWPGFVWNTRVPFSSGWHTGDSFSAVYSSCWFWH